MMGNPVYGLDAFVMTPPWSLLISIGLILGLSALGYIIQTCWIFKDTPLLLSFSRKLSLSPIIGVAILGPILYPLILFSKNAPPILLTFASLLILAGLVFALYVILINKAILIPWFSLKKLASLRIKIANYQSIFLILIMIGYGLIAMGPPTDADELDYHLGVPLRILNTGSWIFAPEWFTSRLAGLGEVLIALGLSVGAEQLGSLLEYCGLLAICSLLIPIKKNGANNQNAIFALVFIISPVLLWLVSTSKPLLLPLSMTSCALALSAIGLQGSNKLHSTHTKLFILICLLIMSASQMKFNFLLSATIVGIFSLILMYQLGLLKRALLIGIVLGGIVLTPSALWKSTYFGGTWYQAIFELLPGNWPGESQFISYLRNYLDSSWIFPFSILFPSNLGNITTVIGVGVVIGCICIGWQLWQLRRSHTKKVIWPILGASLSLIILGTFLGQTGGRFYLEPLAWILFMMTLHNKQPAWLNNAFIKFAISLQAVIIFIGVLFCIWALFPGGLTPSLRNEVMYRHAYEYNIMKWVDSVLPKDAVLATEERSKALSPRHTLSLDWSFYLNYDLLSKDAEPYLEILKANKVNYLLLRGEPNKSPWSGCFLTERKGPFFTDSATRNPFNRGIPIEFWAVRFNSAALPECLNQNSK